MSATSRDTYKARYRHVRSAEERAEALRPVIERLDPRGSRRPSHIANDLMALGVLTVGGSAKWDATAVLRLEARLGIRPDPKRLNRRKLAGKYNRTPEEHAEVAQRKALFRDRERDVRRWAKDKATARQASLQGLANRARAKRDTH